MTDQELKPPIEIPLEKLSEEVLSNIIESFILREGTDYGVSEVFLEKKIEQVRRQIQKKEVRIVFDFETESVTLLPERDWKKLNPQGGF